jgi:hypothetical protein
MRIESYMQSALKPMRLKETVTWLTYICPISVFMKTNIEGSWLRISKILSRVLVPPISAEMKVWREQVCSDNAIRNSIRNSRSTFVTDSAKIIAQKLLPINIMEIKLYLPHLSINLKASYPSQNRSESVVHDPQNQPFSKRCSSSALQKTRWPRRQQIMHS